MSDAGGTTRRSAGRAGTKGPASSGGKTNPMRQPHGAAPGNPGVQINRVSVDDLRKKLSKTKATYVDFYPNVRVRVEPLETGEDYLEVYLEYRRSTVDLPLGWYSTIELSLRYLPAMRRHLDMERMSSRSEKRLGFEVTIDDVASLDTSTEEYKLLSMSNKEFDSWFASQKQTQRPQRPQQTALQRSVGKSSTYLAEQRNAARIQAGGVPLRPAAQFNWADDAASAASQPVEGPAAGASSFTNEGQNAVFQKTAGTHSGSLSRVATPSAPANGTGGTVPPGTGISQSDSGPPGPNQLGGSLPPSLPPPSGNVVRTPLPPPSTSIPGPGTTR